MAFDEQLYDDLIGSAAPAIDLDDTQRFLDLLAPGEQVTFQTFDDKGTDRALAGWRHGNLAQHADWLQRRQQQGAGVFVTVNATDGKGRKAENITGIRALFVDIDKPAPGTLERLRGCDMPPSMIVESSAGKLHAYWLTGSIEKSEFTTLQRRLIAEWGADPACSDATRVLRLPGFLHLKDSDNPQRTRIIEVSGRRYGRELANRYGGSSSASTSADDTDDDTDELLALLPSRVDLATAIGNLSSGVDVHASALGLVGKWLHDGMSEGNIRELFRQFIAPAVAAARGDDRAYELTGDELERMLAGARAKGFAPIKADGCAVEWVDLSDLMDAEIPPVRFIFEPLLPRAEVTLFAADGGTGKSVLGLTLAAHVACGREWAGLKTEPGRVLFLSLEDPANLCRLRLRGVMHAYGLDGRVTRNVLIGDGTDGTGALLTNRDGKLYPTSVLAALQGKARAEPFDLIVIDNASNAFSGNENDRQEVVAFIGELRRLARGCDAALLMLAHVDKASVRTGATGSRYSGSTAWHNSVRSRLAMSADAEGVLTLVQEKMNLGLKLQREIRLAFVEGVPMPCEQIEGFAENAGFAAEREEETILQLMRAAIDAGENIPAAQSGSHTARHLLMRLQGAPAEWGKRPGKSRFDAAMMRLKQKGLVIVEPYKNNQRQAKERLTLADVRQLTDYLDDLTT
ncbi:AAA family ATPase [Pseudomonas sp. NPDC077408]